MTTSALRNEIEAQYTDVEGMVTGLKGPQGRWTSGNHLVITSEYYIMLALRGESLPADGSKFNSLVEGCWDVRDGKRIPGLLNRNDQRWDDQAHDDIQAVYNASYFYGREAAQAIYDYGNRWTIGLFTVRIPKTWKYIGGKSFKVPFACKWYYDNTESTPELDFNKWMGRFPWFAPGLKNAVGKELGWVSQLMFATYFWSGRRDKDLGNASGRKLRWLAMWPMYGKYKICDSQMRKWLEKINADYPRGMADVYGHYYAPDHPYALFYVDPPLKAW